MARLPPCVPLMPGGNGARIISLAGVTFGAQPGPVGGSAATEAVAIRFGSRGHYTGFDGDARALERTLHASRIYDVVDRGLRAMLTRSKVRPRYAPGAPGTPLSV